MQLFVEVPACLRCAKENMGRGSGQIWANVLKGKQLKERSEVVTAVEIRVRRHQREGEAWEPDFWQVSSGAPP